jgi:hypothetical protein
MKCTLARMAWSAICTPPSKPPSAAPVVERHQAGDVVLRQGRRYASAASASRRSARRRAARRRVTADGSEDPAARSESETPVTLNGPPIDQVLEMGHRA